VSFLIERRNNLEMSNLIIKTLMISFNQVHLKFQIDFLAIQASLAFCGGHVPDIFLKPRAQRPISSPKLG